MSSRDLGPFPTLAIAVCFVSLMGACVTIPFDPKPAPDPFAALPNATPPAAAESPAPLERVNVETKSTFYQTAGGDDLGGVSYVSPATTIHWKPEWVIDSERASVEQVIAAAVARLEFIQSRPQASDRNARALWELNKALQVLQGETP